MVGLAMTPIQALTAQPLETLTQDEVENFVRALALSEKYRGKRVLLIVPDNTRTAPIGTLFKLLHAELAGVTSALDVMFALGTHPPMSELAMCARLEVTLTERYSIYSGVNFLNHTWDERRELAHLGTIDKKEVLALSEGLFEMEVPVSIHRAALNYDELILVGPVFPHEVVGFSGGNKYLFPGIGGPEVLNFFHWLGAVNTNAKTIGNKWTPVRRVVDRAAAMLPTPRSCFCLVVDGPRWAGIFFGSPEAAWDQASDLSSQVHIVTKTCAFKTILSVAPTMYDELWVGGKCMYKLEPVLADGGELIIYAPHIHEVSSTHGNVLQQIGYHCRDYFLKQWERFSHLPWGVLAHSTHVYGQGTYEAGVEVARAQVTLATGISRERCRELNLGYRDFRSIRPADYESREAEGVLLVPSAGERLFRLA